MPRGTILPALAAVFLATMGVTRAQVIPAVASGDWADGTIWAGGVVPGAGDTASLSAVTLTLGSNVTVGALEGTAGSTVSLGNGVVLTTGGNNTSTTFVGSLRGGNLSSILTKAGTGLFTLSGANSYAGGTTVLAGTLAVDGATARIAHSAASLSVAALGGSTAALMVQNGARVTSAAGFVGRAAGATGSATVTGTSKVFFAVSNFNSCSFLSGAAAIHAPRN